MLELGGALIFILVIFGGGYVLVATTTVITTYIRDRRLRRQRARLIISHAVNRFNDHF